MIRSKGETRLAVAKMRQSNPCATLREIGDEVGVTPERVRQLLFLERLPTRHLSQKEWVCNHCGKTFTSRQRLFCSPECRRDYSIVRLRCDHCGNDFSRPAHSLSTHNFCSRQCFHEFRKGRPLQRKVELPLWKQLLYRVMSYVGGSPPLPKE